MNNDISSYYPSGQRVLQKKNLEYNYDNFISKYRNRISNEDFATIESNDADRTNFLLISTETKMGIYHTLLRISETILSIFTIFLFFDLILIILKVELSNIVNMDSLMVFMIYAIFSVILSAIATTGFYIGKVNAQITLEANRLNP